MNRAKALAYWLIPPLFCLWVYRLGLRAWFARDDFAWLSLYSHVNNWSDFAREMFEPRAQGTVRPWSERGFFLLFFWLYGLDAPYYRAFVMLTEIANVILVSWIGWKTSTSRLAGFAAAILWTVNAALATPMAWTSSYNQILCALFLLTATALFLKYLETERWQYYAAQWVVFVLGFGALEVNVVYPAIAFSCAIFCARKHWWKPLPMFAVSALYLIVHQLAVPKAGRLYTTYWDISVLSTFWRYLQLAFGSVQTVKLGWGTAPLRDGGTILLLVSVLTFTGWKIYRREYLAVFYASWFIVTLSPVLPFRDHFTDYYLCIPTIGLAWLGGWALAEAIHHRFRPLTAAAGVVVLTYFICSLAVTQTEVRWFLEKSRMVRTLILSLQRAHELYPDKIILLQGVSSDLFYHALVHKPAAALGIKGLYLTPGSDAQIEPHRELADLRDYVMPESAARRALEAGHAVVYDASAFRLRNVTNLVRDSTAKAWLTAAPRSVDVANPDLANLLGPTWYGIDQAIRWMPESATVRMGGPASKSDELCLSGHVPAEILKDGGAQLSLTMDDNAMPPIQITLQGDLDECIPIPTRAVGRDEVVLTIHSNRTFHAVGDQRTLSIAFGKFSIR